LLSSLFFTAFCCNGQSVLEGVIYRLPDPKIRNNDTLWAMATVTIIDSLNKQPLKGIDAWLLGSAGENFPGKVNELGVPRFRVQVGYNYKIIIKSDKYILKQWEFNTKNLSYPVEFNATIELVKKN